MEDFLFYRQLTSLLRKVGRQAMKYGTKVDFNFSAKIGNISPQYSMSISSYSACKLRPKKDEMVMSVAKLKLSMGRLQCVKCSNTNLITIQNKF